MLISFIGHGVATSGGNFFLLARDSPAQPASDTALHLMQVVNEQLDRHRVGGLIFLLDASEVPRDLTKQVGVPAGGPFELLTASDRGAAYSGLFSRALTEIFHKGIPTAGERLRCSDVLTELARLTVDRQTPSHASYSAAHQPELWLVNNLARVSATGESVVPVVQQTTLMFPSFTNDDAVGPDRLGIDEDARALAALIASKQLEPPLAIAVYGEWGSGKTFFMRRVEYYIDRLARGGTATTMFETGVRHIRFGAWHYARGHIWASLLEHIFGTLCPPDTTTEQKFAEVTAQIPIIQETVAAAEQKIDATKQRIKDLDAELAAARQRHHEAIQSLGSVRGRDILQAVTADDALRKRFDTAMNEMGIEAATDSARNLLDSARTAITLANRTTFLATSGKHWYSSPLAVAVAVALLAGGTTAITAALAPDVFRNIGTMIAPLATIGATAAAWIGRQSVLARKLLEPAEHVQRQIEGRIEQARLAQATELAELEADADTAQAELAAANDEKATAVADLEAARQARKELTPARLLDNYIAEMAANGEYTEHLGVVGMAHRHLRGLSDRLHAAATDPAVSIKRIVLHIDDLDRCSPDTVVTVLEAVHLLLAMPLFVVIVGVDTRSLDRSLRSAHPEMLELTEPASTPSDYLEKIFQLSYAIPSMTPKGCQAVLRQVATTSKISSRPVYPGDTLHPSETTFPSGDEQPQTEPATDASATNTPFTQQPISDHQLGQALTLTDDDLVTLDLVAPLVAATPRRAKRFLNTYLVIRARLSTTPHDPAALALLIAVLIGVPHTLGRQLLQADPRNTDTSFRDWLRSTNIDNSADLTRIRNFLQIADNLTNTPMPTILAQLPHARPYAVPAPDAPQHVNGEGTTP
ncbi:P-loop NTPase fold protein [Nocardia sp. NPDC050412]|uniref:P-loop NTPase fold protein n=1 Tax=Nocardia sp. NPDC050412 TaxID=3364320 RepID=UPI0037B1179D